MKEIPLTQNQVALVDDEDFEELNKFKWCAFKRDNTFYAARASSRRMGERKLIFMHRVIINTPDDMYTDHIDNNGLNNQRNNLRPCTNSQNQANREKHIEGTSEYKGLYYDKSRRSWQISITKDGERFQKRRKSEVAAALSYNKMAIELFGEFANLNTIRA